MPPRPADATAKPPGLRERKKIQTRQAIRRAAYRLIAEQGYDATTIDQIAAAADVSPSTVFRYFPTKEDIVLTDEFDEPMAEVLRNRPADEQPLASVRHVIHEMFSLVMHDPKAWAELTMRQALIRDVPALRARSSEGMSATGRLFGSVIAERTGRAADDLQVRVFTAAVSGVMHETGLYWAENGQTEDLLPLLDRTLGMLEKGLDF